MVGFFFNLFVFNVWEVRDDVLLRFPYLNHRPRVYLMGIAYCVGEVLFI